jgi:hypothetical protein
LSADEKFFASVAVNSERQLRVGVDDSVEQRRLLRAEHALTAAPHRAQQMTIVVWRNLRVLRRQ